MNGFDAWESTLYHSGIPGMKWGRRRYQNEDGTWTTLGLKERRSREGFGERREAIAEKKAAKAQHKVEKHAAKVAKKQERAEKLRKMSVKGLTDNELKAKIARLKLEKEYKELNKSPAIKSVENIVTKAMDQYAERYNRKLQERTYNLELLKLKNEREKAKYSYKESENKMKSNIKQAEADVAKAKADLADIKSGTKKIENKTALYNAKTGYRGTTIRGAIGKALNTKAKNIVTVSEAKKAKDEIEARRLRDEAKKRRDAAAEKDQNKARKKAEKELQKELQKQIDNKWPTKKKKQRNTWYGY